MTRYSRSACAGDDRRELEHEPEADVHAAVAEDLIEGEVVEDLDQLGVGHRQGGDVIGEQFVVVLLRSISDSHRATQAPSGGGDKGPVTGGLPEPPCGRCSVVRLWSWTRQARSPSSFHQGAPASRPSRQGCRRTGNAGFRACAARRWRHWPGSASTTTSASSAAIFAASRSRFSKRWLERCSSTTLNEHTSSTSLARGDRRRRMQGAAAQGSRSGGRAAHHRLDGHTGDRA